MRVITNMIKDILSEEFQADAGDPAFPPASCDFRLSNLNGGNRIGVAYCFVIGCLTALAIEKKS